jgi:hypothetical protein
MAAITAWCVTWLAYDFNDGGSIAHAVPSPSTRPFSSRDVENALK